MVMVKVQVQGSEAARPSWNWKKKENRTHLLLLVVELLLALSGVQAGTRLFSWSLSLLLYKGRAGVGPGLLMSAGAGVVDWEGEGAAGGLGVDEVDDGSSITAGARGTSI
jgi:hypothetical protein